MTEMTVQVAYVCESCKSLSVPQCACAKCFKIKCKKENEGFLSTETVEGFQFETDTESIEFVSVL